MAESININNLLCFISSATDDYSESVLYDIVYSFYSIDEIKSAKEKLALILKKDLISRRDPDRKRKELEDTLNFFNDFKNLKTKEIFVANSYKRMPPVGMECFTPILSNLTDEVSRLNELIPKIADIKSEVINTADTVRSLKIDVAQLNSTYKKEIQPKTSPKIPTITAFRKNKVQAISANENNPNDLDEHDSCMLDLNIGNTVASNKSDTTYSAKTPPKRLNSSEILNDITVNKISSLDGLTPSPSYHNISNKIVELQNQIMGNIDPASPGLAPELAVRRKTNAKPSEEKIQRTYSVSQSGAKPKFTLKVPDANLRKESEDDEDGWTLVDNSRKKKKMFEQENGITTYKKTDTKNRKYSRLTGQRQVTDAQFKSSNKTVDVFIGNVDTSIPIEVIEKYVAENFNISIIGTEKLQTKTQSYNCYKITINLNDRETLFNSSLWPTGIVIDKFYSKNRSFN